MRTGVQVFIFIQREHKQVFGCLSNKKRATQNLSSNSPRQRSLRPHGEEMKASSPNRIIQPFILRMSYLISLLCCGVEVMNFSSSTNEPSRSGELVRCRSKLSNAFRDPFKNCGNWDWAVPGADHTIWGQNCMQIKASVWLCGSDFHLLYNASEKTWNLCKPGGNICHDCQIVNATLENLRA